MAMTPTEKARFRVFEAYAEDCADLPDDSPGLDLTEELVTKYMRLANAGQRKVRQDGRRVGACFSKDDIRKWLGNPAEWSPFIDDEAVKRALAFDWNAIENLSRAERYEFHRNLAKMDDPWGLERDEEGDRIAARMARNGTKWNPGESERHRRFKEGTLSQQHVLWGALKYYLQKAAKAA